MNLVLRIWNSSLGKKYLMALSGVVLVLFVIGHMIGNLQIFLGPEAINRYAHFLQSNVELLWPVRLFLLGMVVLHVISAIRLTLENRAARPVDYAHGQPPLAASLASRTMLVGGLVVAAFIIFHLLHYTVKIDPLSVVKADGPVAPIKFQDLKERLLTGETRPDVYAMMIAGFRNPWISLCYAIGVSLLCLHLSHGIAAMFQSLGFRNHVYSPLIEKAAKAIALLLLIGYLSIPAAVLLGLGRAHLEEAVTQAVSSKSLPAPAQVPPLPPAK
ncbi:MAG: succinate dehydrogenase cytochrome b subunit [Verrucomicrobiae bacterium]|nr:succinate dehydrogenase cytochrome b subunit [Verrucomicrobiae bacterium]